MISPAESTVALLRFRSRAGFERVFQVSSVGLVIGSRADAGIRVGVLDVPRDACTISQEEGELRITMAARGCVTVDQRPAREGQPLATGSTLCIGPAAFEIEILK
jgi:predicted component of type VI protein secretion system